MKRSRASFLIALPTCCKCAGRFLGLKIFRYALDDFCMGLNRAGARGAAIEVTFYDAEFDEEEAGEGEESRDDFVMLFVGPTRRPS